MLGQHSSVVGQTASDACRVEVFEEGLGVLEGLTCAGLGPSHAERGSQQQEAVLGRAGRLDYGYHGARSNLAEVLPPSKTRAVAAPRRRRSQHDGRRPRYDVETARRRARPGPYPPPDGRGARPEAADPRLARLAAIPLRAVQRLGSQTRDELIEHHRVQRDGRRTAEREALWARLADLGIGREGYEDA